MTQVVYKPISVYVVEGQEIYRAFYTSVYGSRTADPRLRLLGVSADGNLTAARTVISELDPDVLLVGAKSLPDSAAAELGRIREENPNMGLVLLLSSCDPESAGSIQEMARQGRGGMVVFKRQCLDQVKHLTEAVVVAGQGRFILDPALSMLVIGGNASHECLRDLTGRESEVLGLLAQAYTNSAIADALSIDVRTVEYHVASLYNKVRSHTDLDRKHPRVTAARLYLELAGSASAA